MANPHLVLRNNPYAAPQYYYPLDLGSQGREPYIIFDIRDSVAVNAPSKGTIALYMPPEVRTGYRALYDDHALGIFGQTVEQTVPMLENAAKSIVNQGSKIMNGDLNAIGSAIKGIANLNMADLLESGGAAVASVVEAAQLLATASSVRAQRFFKKMVNPHQAIIFRGVGFRAFSLNFTLVAKSPEESDMINNIIYTFKYHMHPHIPEDSVTQRYLLYPENFVIGLYSPSPKYLFQTSPCVLESMDVDYAGSGTPAFFADTGAPVHVNMSLVFRETEIMTKDRIKEGC